MPLFRKKPLITVAVQVRWETWNEVCDMLGDIISERNPGREIPPEEASDTCGEPGPTYIAVDFPTTHGDVATARHGDWIIPDSKPGTFYPVKPDVFEMTYEPEPFYEPDPRLAHLRADAPFVACPECGRKSWADNSAGSTCGMTQPDGIACEGVFGLPVENRRDG